MLHVVREGEEMALAGGDGAEVLDVGAVVVEAEDFLGGAEVVLFVGDVHGVFALLAEGEVGRSGIRGLWRS